MSVPSPSSAVRIGYVLSEKRIRKLSWLHDAEDTEVEFINLCRPGAPAPDSVDALLHKATDDITMTEHPSEFPEDAVKEASDRVAMVLENGELLIDSAKGARALTSRTEMSQLLRRASGVHGGLRVRAPDNATVASAEELRKLAASRVGFPVVVKSDRACCACLAQ